MNSQMKNLVGKQVNIKMLGKFAVNGILKDLGDDILVVYNGQQFLYIPLDHVDRIQMNPNKDEFVEQPPDVSPGIKMDDISFQGTINNAIGIYTEISVICGYSFHGWITDALDDYFVFHSPLYGQMYVSNKHMKWLIPFTDATIPYSFSTQPLKSTRGSFLANFGDQMKREIGKLVILNGGKDTLKMGYLKNIDQDTIELVVANGDTVYLNFQHVKSVQLP
ncbi:LSm family protein [Pseudoneobacillus sp. C159]